MPSPIGKPLQKAVRQLRTELNDPTAPIAVVTPSSANGILARQQLALAGPFIRVEFLTPERIVADVGRHALLQDTRHVEPAGWLATTLEAAVAELDNDKLAGYKHTLQAAGWIPSLEQAVRRLEAAGIGGSALAELSAQSPRPRRLTLLASLLNAAAVARDRDGLVSDSELHAAALDFVNDGNAPYRHIAGAVALGDRSLTPSVFAAFRAWLSMRRALRLVMPHLQAVPPAAVGLREACADLETVEMPRPAPEIRIARTPDELRELAEVVRAIQDDIVQDGVPLDQIAVTLPNSEHADVLAEHLKTAGIPATWLLGPSLARTAAGSFLALAHAMATHPPTAQQWYDLLVQPGFRLRQELGPAATSGMGRWRRLLARCGVYEGTEALIDGLESGISESYDPEGDRSAVDALTLGMRAFHDALDDIPQQATLAEYAVAWRNLLERWWQPSTDRSQVQRLIDTWGERPVGPLITREQAGAFLADSLESAQRLSGRINDRAILVLPAMSALGGAFQRVYITGMDEGRFPRQRREHPILSDDVLNHLNQSLGRRLITSANHHDAERRRLASALSAASDPEAQSDRPGARVCLTWAGSEMLQARPRLPGRLLVELLSWLRNARATLANVREASEQWGSRAQPLPADPERAVGAVDFLGALSVSRGSDVVHALASHPVARRLLALALAQARIRRALAGQNGDAPESGATSLPNRLTNRLPDLDEWTGKVDPAMLALPGLEHPFTARELARLINEPGKHLLGGQLEARRAVRFWGDAGFERRIQSRTIQAIEQALQDDPNKSLALRFENALRGLENEQADPDMPEARRAAVRQLSRELFDAWREHGAADRASSAELAQPVSLPDLELAVEGAAGLLSQDGVLSNVTRSAKPWKAERLLELLFQGLALREAGRSVEKAAHYAIDGRKAEKSLDGLLAELDPDIRRRLALWDAGYVGTLHKDIRLSGDPDEDALERLERLERLENTAEIAESTLEN